MGGYVRGQGALYLSVSRGKLRNKRENVELDGWEGVITAIDKAEDDYEGQVRLRYQLTMQDNDGKVAKIQFTDETWFYAGLFSRLPSVDVTQPVLIGVIPSEQNDKISFCWMRQGNKKITPVEGFPKPHKAVVGRKEVYDYTETNAFVDRVLISLAGEGVVLTGLIAVLSYQTLNSMDGAGEIQLDNGSGPAGTKEELPF